MKLSHEQRERLAHMDGEDFSNYEKLSINDQLRMYDLYKFDKDTGKYLRKKKKSTKPKSKRKCRCK